MECSQDLDSFIRTRSGLINFCNGLQFRGKIADVEAYFNKLLVSPIGTPTSPQSVTYRLKNANEKELYTVKQTFTFVDKLALKYTNDVFKFNPTQNGKSSLMATVDLAPFQDAGIDPEFDVQLQTVPFWLHVYFSGSSLYFKIETALRAIQMGGFQYNIIEKKTGVKSQDLFFSVETILNSQEDTLPDQSHQEKASGSKPGFLRLLFFFIVVGGLFYFFCVYKKNAAGATRGTRIVIPQKVFQKEDEFGSNSFEIKDDILTDSVISWNKDLMARKTTGKPKGAEGAVLVTEDDLGADHSEINPDYNSGVFGKGMEEISVISRDPNAHRGGPESNSAFLDGLNI
jgi:hypothetical protein